MKLIVAIVLVVASLSSAEPPRFGSLARQTESVEGAPYSPRGWRPSGPAFNLPEKSQAVYSAPPQTYGAPSPSYGPPPQEYGPPEEPTTTETPNATEAFGEGVTEESTEQAENVQRLQASKPEKLQNEKQNPLFFVIPQRENLVYLQQSAPLVAVPQTKILANLQSVPYSPVSSPFLTPFSGSYVQIYQ